MANDFMTPEQQSKFFSSLADALNEALALIPKDQTVTIGMFILKGTKRIDNSKLIQKLED